MSDLERIESLERENARLRENNAALHEIISQMRTTLNRMVSRFITGTIQ